MDIRKASGTLPSKASIVPATMARDTQHASGYMSLDQCLLEETKLLSLLRPR